MERKLTALLGARPNRKIEFAPRSDLSREHIQRLRDLVVFLSQQLSNAEASMPKILLQELEEAILIAFLSVNEHTFSRHLLEDALLATPREVRRAEEYIEANWDRSISIEQLVEVTNVSARSLFRAFRRTRSYSPKGFAKIVRLRHAKAFLETGDPGTTVIGTALRCGFSNPSHFSSDYRKVFGENPSTTLVRASWANDVSRG